MDARSCTCLCWPWAPLRAAWQHKAAHGRPRTQLGGRTHHGQSLGVIVRSWDVHHLSFIIFFSNRVFSTSFPNSPASAVTIEASLYQTSVCFRGIVGVCGSLICDFQRCLNMFKHHGFCLRFPCGNLVVFCG